MTILSEAQIASFQQRGLLKIPERVLTDEQVEDLRDALARVMEGQGEGQPELYRNLAGGELTDNVVVVQIVNIWAADHRFRKHIEHPVITQMAAELIGADLLRIWHDQIQYKPPVTGGISGWHQDYPAWPILEPADLLSAWVALDDATVENGCMSMVPGSHRWGIHRGLGTGPRFELQYDPDQVPAGESVEAVPCPVPKGCVMYHHCLTWHGSPANPSPKPRRAIAAHYMPGYTRYVPVGGHVVERRVTVQPGEVLEGEFFPVCYSK